MDSVLNLIATLGVAIISLIGVVIQKGSKQDVSKINKKIDKLREETLDADKALNTKVDELTMNNIKRFIITEMSKIQNQDYTPNEEQKRMLKEAKDEYNKAGGDSYVDDMYDDLRARNLL
jgi:low affinity Fe/Cu permease